MLIVPIKHCLASSKPPCYVVRLEELEKVSAEWEAAEELPGAVFLQISDHYGRVLQIDQTDQFNVHYVDLLEEYFLTIKTEGT